MARHAAQSVGEGGQDELSKETNKVLAIERGAFEPEVRKVNVDLGKFGGVFAPKRPSCANMVAKA